MEQETTRKRGNQRANCKQAVAPTCTKEDMALDTPARDTNTPEPTLAAKVEVTRFLDQQMGQCGENPCRGRERDAHWSWFAQAKHIEPTEASKHRDDHRTFPRVTQTSTHVIVHVYICAYVCVWVAECECASACVCQSSDGFSFRRVPLQKENAGVRSKDGLSWRSSLDLATSVLGRPPS